MVHPPYEEAFWLVVLAAQAWPRIDAQAALQGRDLLGELNFRRFLNVVDTWYRDRMQDEDDHDEYERQLSEPTPLMKAPYAGRYGPQAATDSGFMEFFANN